MAVRDNHQREGIKKLGTLFQIQGRGGLGAIYTFAAGNGGITGDSCAYNGYVNSIYTIAINGVNKDGTNPTYAEECPGVMAAAYSRDSFKGLGKVVSEVKQDVLETKMDTGK